MGEKTFPAHAPVTAIHLVPVDDQVSLFAVDFSGYVWSTHATGADAWTPWYRVAHPKSGTRSPTITFPQGAEVTALQPGDADGSVALYAIGLDGRVWTAHFPDENPPHDWSDWYPLGQGLMSADDPEILFTPGARVTALHATAADGATTLFAVASDGRVWSTRWPSAATPTAWTNWLPIHSHTFEPGSSVAAVHASDEDGAVALFVRGADGHVWTTEWPDCRPPHSWSSWSKVADRSFVGGSPIATPVRSAPGTIDLFLKDSLNCVWTTTGSQGGGAWADWSMLPFNPLFGRGAPTTIHARPAEGGVAIFAPDMRGDVWSMFRRGPDPACDWSGWYVI